jgi:hypothetical protein
MENTIPEFSQLISNVVQREIVFHLSDLTCGIRAIKFIHIHTRGTWVQFKVVGRKRGGLRGFRTFKFIRCGRREWMWGGLKQDGQIIHCVLTLLTQGGQFSEGCGKCFEQSKLGFEVINTGSNGRNINTSLVISIVQGSETLFPILDVSMGHGGTWDCTKRGYW